MGATALQAHGPELGATGVGEYRGATTPSRFGDPQSELDALRTGCGVYDLGFRAKILLAGRDRVRWLNGMITNNIRDLAVDHGVYGFMLNPQGHILADLYAYNQGESILVDTDHAQLEKILGLFTRYIIMDRVDVKNMSDELTALGISGTKSREVLQKAGVGVPDLQPLERHTVQCDCECGCLKCTVVRSDDPSTESYEIWLAPAHVKPLWDTLVKAGGTRVGSEALEMQRILSGIPRYGVDIHERDLPHETEQARALNFSKGCYIGQEIVERIRSRGAVHRKLSGFLTDAPVMPGSTIVMGEKEVGEVTSATSLGLADRQRSIALGYIRREASAPGSQVRIGEVAAKVTTLPFSEATLAGDGRSLSQRPA